MFILKHITIVAKFNIIELLEEIMIIMLRESQAGVKNNVLFERTEAQSDNLVLNFNLAKMVKKRLNFKIKIMINGSMAALPAALTGQLGMTLQSHQNINHQLSQLSAFGISGGRSRMPDAHVEMLLDCYKAVQEERTLDSGRLGKGAFHQVIKNLPFFVKLTTNVLFTRQIIKKTAASVCITVICKV